MHDRLCLRPILDFESVDTNNIRHGVLSKNFQLFIHFWFRFLDLSHSVDSGCNKDTQYCMKIKDSCFLSKYIRY